MADKKFCKFCGASVRPDGKFCVKCGNALDGTTVARRPPPIKTNLKTEQANWVFEQVKGYLTSDEHVGFIVSGWYATKDSVFHKDTQRQGFLVATDKKILFYGKRLQGRFDFEVFQYANISSIGLRKTLDGFGIGIDAFGNTFVLRRIQTEIAEGFIHYVQSVMQTIKSQTPAPLAAQERIDVADQIRKLAELRDQGIVTEQEFQEQKKKLLGT